MISGPENILFSLALALNFWLRQEQCTNETLICNECGKEIDSLWREID